MHLPPKEYKKCLASNLFGGVPANNRVLSFASPRSPSSADAVIAAKSTTADGCDDTLRMLYNVADRVERRAGAGIRERAAHSAEPTAPSPQHPELLDDYYLNLLDWRKTENILGKRALPFQLAVPARMVVPCVARFRGCSREGAGGGEGRASEGKSERFCGHGAGC